MWERYLERLDTLHTRWLEAAAKFDYFVLGATLVLLGYVAQSDALGPITWFGSGTVELIALVLLFGSAVCGMQRVRVSVDAAHSTYQRQLAELERATPKAKKAIEGERTSFTVQAERWETARNWLLLAGFAALVGARIMRGYGL